MASPVQLAPRRFPFIVFDWDGTLIDSTAVAAIRSFAEKAHRAHAALFLSGAAPAVRKILMAQGVRPPLAEFRITMDEAIAAAHEAADKPAPQAAVVASGTH